jgi:asparagine synthetase B (glutamine-hydrolysing)
MSDFLLDLRPQPCRALGRAADRLQFAEDTRTVIIDRPLFGLVITYTGDAALWAPYCADPSLMVAVAGRPVFEANEWELARANPSAGGLASKIIHGRLQALGLTALEQINGNAVIVACDFRAQVVHLVTDPCGAFPAFAVDTAEGRVYCSHPDVLADAANEQHRIDEASLAEFVLAGTVTPPFSYYERIRGAEPGTIFSFDLRDGRREPLTRRYFDLIYRGDVRAREDDLANELADSVRRAVQRRTSAALGRTAVALSGGLDSRVVLACSADKEQTFAFCCYDETNRELKTAEAVARSLSARFIPMRRDPDYYADYAEQGVRISGGMGNFANNHFLGVIPRLKQEGMSNLLTGCYCDYLFKGLPLNRRTHWLTRREALAPFRDEFYFDHVPASSTLAARASERWQARIPEELRRQQTPSAIFQVEARRTFPLSYEGDNQQRLVPQRIAGWCPPLIDRDVLDVYCRLPYNFKLNRSVFRKAAVALAADVRAIPDANTGAALDARAGWEWVRSQQLRAQRTWRRVRRSTATDGSWPNWQEYLTRSRKIDALWKRPNPDAMDLFQRILGRSDVLSRADDLKHQQPFLFVGLLTAKLWLDQRAASNA